MTDTLTALLREGKITHYEYCTYLLFAGNDVGAQYLKDSIESSFMEEPIDPKKTLFIWHDGRRSVWRDIKSILNKIESILKGEKNGRSSNK